MVENKDRDYKSLRLAIGSRADLKKLAEICVCFANAQGGEIIIGIEDATSEPPTNQRVNQTNVNEIMKKLRGLTDGVGIVDPSIIRHINGGEYFVLKILPSVRAIATTSSGKVFIRVSDNCFPVSSNDLTHLAAEKTAFQWEIITPQKVSLSNADEAKVNLFIQDIRSSDKVSEFIKNKEAAEIAEFYQLVNSEGGLTNLGILWLGTPAQRARLNYPLTIQYIVYNEREEKIRKRDWHFHRYNPKELLLELEREAVELTYSTELPDGLFRKNIRQYPREVVRELLINAIAHRSYTISSDIFIKVYPDRMTITSPGSLPLGIDENNILHKQHRRNPHLIKILNDLKLMEGEGSGYDLVYEKLARDAKPMPQIESEFMQVSVTVYSNSVDNEAVSILDYIDKYYQLTQKEYITLGLIATEKKILSTQLARKLQLNQEDKMRFWIGTLIDNGIIISRGARKGTAYLLNPVLFSQAKIDIIPSLKTIEPYKLEALIIEDLKYNGRSKIADIQNRLNEAPKADIQKTLYKMVNKNVLTTGGAKKDRTYDLKKNK
ncbi:ATP-binding protein [Tunicatimonas pelagia]|uniref:ATP-binding protein n=1 Tax=Tunicatimonas pelagia TaxID=931531 RepID=UPI00266578C1|nr:ATP-binding protein [Tunicatimonas pelagia]WKN45556.1 ATP-binding protein [Tunicatimonas pelagia]